MLYLELIIVLALNFKVKNTVFIVSYLSFIHVSFQANMNSIFLLLNSLIPYFNFKTK